MKKAILISKRPITRTEGSKAFPLNEADLPKGNGTSAALGAIIKYLAVEKSARYKVHSVNGSVVSTYCNIYAFDYCNLAGGYLPRVWWGKDVMAKIKAGEDLEPVYGKTVFELNANALYDWFMEYADDFGWQKVTDMNDAQGYANSGMIVILVAKQKVTSRSGHITAVVPETPEHKAQMAGKIFEPLQSQAGASNKSYFTGNWFLHPRYSGWGCWAFKPF